MASAADNAEGISMAAKDIRPTGCILSFAQKNGKIKGKLQTGQWYVLERQGKSGTWSKVSVKHEPDWEDIAYRIKPNQMTEMRTAA